MSTENNKGEELEFNIDDFFDENEVLEEFSLDNEKQKVDIEEVLEPLKPATLSSEDKKEVDDEVKERQTALRTYKTQLEQAIANKEELRTNDDLTEKADIIRTQFLTARDDREKEDAIEEAFQIGKSPQNHSVPFYQFEKDLRGSYFKGVKARKQMTIQQEGSGIISQYTLSKNERNVFNKLMDQYQHDDTFQEFAIRNITINEYAKKKVGGLPEGIKREQLYTDEGFTNLMKDPIANEIREGIKNTINTKLDINESLNTQYMLILAKSLKNDLSLKVVVNSYQKFIKTKYDKHLEQVEQNEQNDNLQNQKIETALKNYPNAHIEKMLPIEEGNSIEAQIKRLTNSENPSLKSAGFPDAGLGIKDIIPLSGHGFIIPKSSDNKLENDVVIIKSSKDIREHELLRTIGQLEKVDADALILPTDNPENIHHTARENSTVHEVNGQYIRLYQSPVNNSDDQKKFYYQDIPKTLYKELLKNQEPQPVKNQEIITDNVVDLDHQKNMINLEKMMTRLMVVEESIKKDKEDFATYIKQINKRKDLYKDQKAGLIDAFRDEIFSPEAQIYKQFKEETLEISTLKLRGEKIKPEDKQRLDYLQENHKDGLDAFIAQSYITNDNYFNTVQKRHPEIVKSIKDNIHNNVDPKSTNKEEARAQASLQVFGKKHKVSLKSLIKHFIKPDKENLKKGLFTTLKATSAVINPTGFLVSQGIKKLIMSDKMKSFRENVSERICNSLDFLGARQGTKARTYLATGAAVIGAISLGTYVVMTGDLESAEIAYGNVEENIKEKFEKVATNFNEYTSAENIAAVKQAAYEKVSTLNEAVKNGFNNIDFTNNAFAENIQEAETLTENNNVDNTVVDPKLNNIEPLPEVIPEEIIPAEQRIEFNSMNVAQSEQFANNLWSQIDENAIQETLSKVDGVSEEDLKNHIQANIEKQISQGTFPTKIELDINVEDWRGREQIVGSFSFSENMMYDTANSIGLEQAEITVQNGDTLSEIAEGYLGANASPENVEAMIAKIAEMNNISNPDLIFPDQKLTLPNPNQLLADNTWQPNHLSNDPIIAVEKPQVAQITEIKPMTKVVPISLAEMYTSDLYASDTLHQQLAQGAIEEGQVLPENKAMLEAHFKEVIENHKQLNGGNLSTFNFQTDINGVIMEAQEPKMTSNVDYENNLNNQRKSASMAI